MGWDVHITRAEDWTESKDAPIAEDAWKRVVDADPTLTVNEASWYQRATDGGGEQSLHPVEWSGHPERAEVALWYADGEITSKNPDDATIIKMVELARKLEARVLGDDGERYDVNASGVLTTDGEVSAARAPGPADSARGASPVKRPYTLFGLALLLAFVVLRWVLAQ